MGNKRHKPEEIVTKLRHDEALVGHRLALQHLAEIDGEATALFYARLIEPRPGVSPHRCTLYFRLEKLDIDLDFRLRCAEMQLWKNHMRAVIAGVRDGVVSSEPNAMCDVPPNSAAIVGDRFDEGFRESMPRWLDLHRSRHDSYRLSAIILKRHAVAFDRFARREELV